MCTLAASNVANLLPAWRRTKKYEYSPLYCFRSFCSCVLIIITDNNLLCYCLQLLPPFNTSEKQAQQLLGTKLKEIFTKQNLDEYSSV